MVKSKNTPLLNLMEERIYSVYEFIFPNGKRYIGITKQIPEYRWGHNGYKYKSQKLIGRAIYKYGWDNIVKNVVFKHLTKIEACNKEIELIAKYNSTNIKYGYNLSSGGIYGEHSNTKQVYLYDINTGVFIKKWKTADKASDELNINRSIIASCCRGKLNVLKNKYIFLYTYYKQLPIELLKKRLSVGNKTKKVYMYNKEGRFLSSFDSINEAARRTKFASFKISNSCNGIIKEVNDLIFLFDYYLQLPDDILKARFRRKPKGIKIYRYTKDGTFIDEWESASEAAKCLKTIKANNISACCNRKAKTVGSFIFLKEKYAKLPIAILKDRVQPINAAKRKAIIELNSGKVFNSLTEAANFYGHTTTEVSKVIRKNLSHIKGNRFVLLKDYEKNPEYYDNLAKEKVIIKPKSSKIIEIESRKIFNTAADASKFFNIASSNIRLVCKGIQDQVKGHRFVYLEEYENNLDYYKNLAKEKVTRRYNSRKIIELKSGKEFNSVKEAAKFFNISRCSIIDRCRGRVKYAKELKFMYYEDYLEMQHQKQKESLNQMENLDTTEINNKYKESVKALNEIDNILHDLKTLIAKEEMLADNLITI